MEDASVAGTTTLRNSPLVGLTVFLWSQSNKVMYRTLYQQGGGNIKPMVAMASKIVLVKRALTRLSAAQLIERACAHVAALTGNALFPDPQPDLVTIANAITALVLADDAVLNNGGRQDYLARDQRMRELHSLLVLLAAYVQMQSRGDAEAILSTGFPLRKRPVPAGPLPAPGNLRAEASALSGIIKLHWARVRHRKLYEVQFRTNDPQGPGNWDALTQLSRNSCSATGLQSGVPYSFRVRAVGAAGPGPWSDVATERPR